VSKCSTTSAHTEYANTQAIQIDLRSNIQQYHTPPTGISHPSSFHRTPPHGLRVPKQFDIFLHPYILDHVSLS